MIDFNFFSENILQIESHFVSTKDGDDQNPEFFHSSYTATLPRDSTVGYQLRVQPETIGAFDKDTGINATIQYKILDGANFFDINKNSGAVFVNATVPQVRISTLVSKLEANFFYILLSLISNINLSFSCLIS